MKKILLISLLLAASFNAQARGSHGYSATPHSLQRSPAHRSRLFAPRVPRHERQLHHLPLSTVKKLHKEGLDNTVSAFI
jgi:hypothetical protein